MQSLQVSDDDKRAAAVGAVKDEPIRHKGGNPTDNP